jgi:hypothetical protein
MRLPPVLSVDDLPVPELRAARLDGELFAVGDCFSPVDEIEQPALRAAALHAGQSGRLIGELLSAAWVWGALDEPPQHLQFCVATGARVKHSAARWMTVREVIIDPDEIFDLDGRLVTTRQRTCIDLVRFSEKFDDREVAIVRRLGGSLDEAARFISSRRNLPNKRRTIGRLARCR